MEWKDPFASCPKVDLGVNFPNKKFREISNLHPHCEELKEKFEAVLGFEIKAVYCDDPNDMQIYWHPKGCHLGVNGVIYLTGFSIETILNKTEDLSDKEILEVIFSHELGHQILNHHKQPALKRNVKEVLADIFGLELLSRIGWNITNAAEKMIEVIKTFSTSSGMQKQCDARIAAVKEMVGW